MKDAATTGEVKEPRGELSCCSLLTLREWTVIRIALFHHRQQAKVQSEKYLKTYHKVYKNVQKTIELLKRKKKEGG